MAKVARERRRVPRVNASQQCVVSLGTTFPVQVMEIGPAGVLLASKAALEIGDRAELQAVVGARSLRVGIEIRDVSLETRARSGPRYRIGAAFVGVAEQRVQLLDLLGVGRS